MNASLLTTLRRTRNAPGRFRRSLGRSCPRLRHWRAGSGGNPAPLTFGAALLLAALLVVLHGRLNRVGFYLIFALAVTASVQLVGVYLVFASLIIPSLATRNHVSRRRLPLAYAIGAAGYAAGLMLSSIFDLPSGALIVWCLAGLAIVVYWLGPGDN